MDFGIATVSAITALVYVVGLLVRTSPLDNKWIPTICGVTGIILGFLALAIKVPDFPATDYLTAGAVGAVSGLAATGINEAVKQLIDK